MINEKYPQKLQHVYVDNFLKRLGYRKSIYGAETELTESNNHILIHHLDSGIPGEAIVFFSLEQFKKNNNKLDYSLMKKILENGYDLLIAMQEICILSSGDHDLSSIFLVNSSVQSRRLRKVYVDNLK